MFILNFGKNGLLSRAFTMYVMYVMIIINNEISFD